MNVEKNVFPVLDGIWQMKSTYASISEAFQPALKKIRSRLACINCRKKTSLQKDGNFALRIVCWRKFATGAINLQPARTNSNFQFRFTVGLSSARSVKHFNRR